MSKIVGACVSQFHDDENEFELLLAFEDGREIGHSVSRKVARDIASELAGAAGKSTIDHGGFAFPTQAICTPAGDVMSSADDGMSLRNYYAGKALVGLTTANPSAHLGINPGYAKHVAEACFVLADAMIAAGKEGV